MKIVIFFLVVIVSLSVNISDSIVGRMGFDNNYILVALTALVFSGMVAQRRLMVIIFAALLAVVANLPEATVESFGFGLERDYVAAALIALLSLPYVLEWFE